MEKTKLGLSVPVVGALTYLLFLFGGYTPALLLVGYILLRESDAGLKKTVVTAMLAAVLFSAANVVIGLLPDIINIFDSLLAIFGGNLGLYFVSNIANFLYNILALLKIIAMVGLAILTLLGKPLKLSIIDKLMD